MRAWGGGLGNWHRGGRGGLWRAGDRVVPAYGVSVSARVRGMEGEGLGVEMVSDCWGAERRLRGGVTTVGRREVALRFA